MTDVNQGWDLVTAKDNWGPYSDFGLRWIEEPLPADRPISEWQALAAQPGSPIAAGENLLGDAEFDAHIEANVFGVVQPDMCKWGGFTKTLPLAKRIVATGLTYCPHFLAGPIGVMSAAHCLAVAGGDGVLEIDANANPIRERLTGGLPGIENGIMSLPEAPGLVWTDTARLEFAVTDRRRCDENQRNGVVELPSPPSDAPTVVMSHSLAATSAMWDRRWTS